MSLFPFCNAYKSQLTIQRTVGTGIIRECYEYIPRMYTNCGNKRKNNRPEREISAENEIRRMFVDSRQREIKSISVL